MSVLHQDAQDGLSSITPCPLLFVADTDSDKLDVLPMTGVTRVVRNMVSFERELSR